MGVSLQVTVPKKKKKKVPPLEGVTTKVNFSRKKKLKKKSQKVGLLQGGVVVGLLHGGCSSRTTTWGGCNSPKKIPKKKVEQKIRQFRRALNRLDPLYVGKYKKKSLLFPGGWDYYRGGCSSPTTTGGCSSPTYCPILNPSKSPKKLLHTMP